MTACVLHKKAFFPREMCFLSDYFLCIPISLCQLRVFSGDSSPALSLWTSVSSPLVLPVTKIFKANGPNITSVIYVNVPCRFKYVSSEALFCQLRVFFGDSSPDSISLDFARLVLAPVLARGSTSMFSFAAALARAGPVYSAPNPEEWGWRETDLGSDWIWVRTAKVHTK
jgi:hypothetical protein